MIKYVVGLAFSMDLKSLVLIQKNRGPMGPLLNGVGGKIKAHVEYPIRNVEEDLINWYNNKGGIYKEETPHEAMSREFQEETGVFIPANKWHCFHITTWAHTKAKVYFFYVASELVLRAQTMEDEEVIIINFPETPFMEECTMVYDLPYIIQMCLTHVKKGDIFCLNPEGINLEKQNPTGVMGCSSSNRTY